jgi:hypothetical protein
MSSLFNASELFDDIQEHIAYRGNSDTVNLLWTGHLAALAYGESLGWDEFFALLTVLKPVGREEVGELFSKFMDTTETNGETDFFNMLIDVIKADDTGYPAGRDAAIAEMERILGRPKA